ncbi:hypothetical protein TNCV_1078521 [Trichonephila clavipes]|nr:hypothetical protein TNCV_1078521 [Trichonephila clavipes]
MQAVIRYLWAKNVTASDTHSRQDVENCNMTGSDRSTSSMTEVNATRVEEMIQNDERVNLREISSYLGLRYGSVQHIVSDVPRPGSMDRDLISTKTG